MFKIGFCLSKYIIEGLEFRFFLKYATIFSFTEHQIFSSLTAATIFMYYPMGRNISFLICLLCCNVDISELSLGLNSTHVNLVLFYTTQKIRYLSLFFELGSYLICLYATGPKSNCSNFLTHFILKCKPSLLLLFVFWFPQWISSRL